MPSAIERGDALAVGRDLVQRVAAVVDADRLDPVVRVRGEIVERQRGAVLLRERGDFLRELARVERFASRLGDALQRLRLRGKRELLARLRARVRAA